MIPKVQEQAGQHSETPPQTKQDKRKKAKQNTGFETPNVCESRWMRVQLNEKHLFVEINSLHVFLIPQHFIGTYKLVPIKC